MSILGAHSIHPLRARRRVGFRVVSLVTSNDTDTAEAARDAQADGSGAPRKGFTPENSLCRTWWLFVSRRCVQLNTEGVFNRHTFWIQKVCSIDLFVHPESVF